MCTNLNLKVLFLLVVTGLFFFACSEEPNRDPEKSVNYYALLTGDMTTSPFFGYLTTYTEIPSGSIDNAKSGSLSIQTNGMRGGVRWIFKRTSLATEGKDDLVRYSVDANGKMKEDGRISSGKNSNYCIYNDTLGFYVD